MSDQKINIEVEEVNLEDLIILGDDRLINILIEYPQKTEDNLINIVKTKAKIKQLTLKELRNIDVKNMSFNVAATILGKALFTQDETPFSKELILALPIGVVFAITREIMKISGVDENQLGF